MIVSSLPSAGISGSNAVWAGAGSYGGFVSLQQNQANLRQDCQRPVRAEHLGTVGTWYCFTVLMLFFMLLLLLLLCAVRGIGKNQNLSLPFWQTAVQLKHSELAQSSVNSQTSHESVSPRLPVGQVTDEICLPNREICLPQTIGHGFYRVLCPCGLSLSPYECAMWICPCCLGWGGGGGEVSVVSLTGCVPRYGFGESWTCTCTFGHYVRRGGSQQIDLVGMWSVKVDGTWSVCSWYGLGVWWLWLVSGLYVVAMWSVCGQSRLSQLCTGTITHHALFSHSPFLQITLAK